MLFRHIYIENGQSVFILFFRRGLSVIETPLWVFKSLNLNLRHCCFVIVVLVCVVFFFHLVFLVFVDLVIVVLVLVVSVDIVVSVDVVVIIVGPRNLN